MARNPLQTGDDGDNALSLAPWQVGDPTDPMAVAGAQVGVQPVDALGQWLAAQRRKSAQMGLWNDQAGRPTMAGIMDAIRQTGTAVALGTGTPGRMKPGLVDVGDVTAHVNPSKADIARMMQNAPEYELRAFHDPETGNFAIWPGWHAIHDDMRVPLGFTKDAINMKLHGRVGPPDADYPGSAGRFSFFQTADPRPPRGR